MGAQVRGYFCVEVDSRVDSHGLKRTPRGWQEQPPPTCANGHRLARNALVGVQHCECGTMHRTHWCKTCGDTTYTPPRADGCRSRALDDR
ncbi:hypothetical protein I5G87_gp38 [Mycobacterium phage Ekdilam]|uniref:Uncharacterized protein n=1 Tax=Mycobacterium phage Ekdilam TaxID=2599862 RepID=A0A5J6TRX7_9CAUD|nr:hypothetical protein I5G87_gp38 [Mycobacterium phage Ekdilam]QFG11462.1 hypothetical protein PBI_EKDILAM_38 [Mycobacterium phage Ekdilam]